MDDSCSVQGASSSTTQITTTEATTPQNHDDLGPQLNSTIWFLVGVSALFLGLRLYCKVWRRRGLWWDDHFLVASWVTLALSTALQSVSISLGLGKHNIDINPDNFQGVVMFSYIAGFCSILATLWSKISFAITLLRISNGWVKILIWFIIIATNMVFGTSATLQWVQCWPVAKLWDPTVLGTCLPSVVVKNYGTFLSIYSGTMDIVLALLPWKIIWGTTMQRKEKLGALAAMSMGVFAGITSFLKLTTLSAIGNDDIATTVNLFIFGTAESAITIMAASIPILRALLRQGRAMPPRSFVRLDERQWAGASDTRVENRDVWQEEDRARKSLEAIASEKRVEASPWI